MIKFIVYEVVSCGIIVNVVVSGFIVMVMIDKLIDDQKEKINVQILMGCMGILEEIVVVVLYLVSFEVGYVIGMILYVNGGMVML